MYSLISVAGCAGKERVNPPGDEPSNEKRIIDRAAEGLQAAAKFPHDIKESFKEGIKETYDDVSTALIKQRDFKYAQENIDQSCGGDNDNSEQCIQAKETFNSIVLSRRSNQDVKRDLQAERDKEEREQELILEEGQIVWIDKEQEAKGKIRGHEIDAGVQKAETAGQTINSVAGGSSSRENEHAHGHTKIEMRGNTSQFSNPNQDRDDQPEEPDLG